MHAMQGWNDRKTRFPVEIEAVAQRSDGTKVSVRVSNFSEMGCRIETTAPSISASGSRSQCRAWGI